MPRTPRLPAVLSAAVAAALTGALLAAPTSAHAETRPAPPASHVKKCAAEGLSKASTMRLRSTKKAAGRSGRMKATATAWVYTRDGGSKACVVTSAKSPQVKRTRKTTDVSYGGSSTVESDATIRFVEGGHQFNFPDIFGNSSMFVRWGRKAPTKLDATVIDLVDEKVMTAEDLQDFPAEMQTLEGKRYRMEATSLAVRWQLEGERTAKVKKMKKARATRIRKAEFKKIATRRAAGMKQARKTWKQWSAAQPQRTPEERAWVKFYGGLALDVEKMFVSLEAQAEKSEARQTAKDAVRGRRPESVYDIEIELPLKLPQG